MRIARILVVGSAVVASACSAPPSRGVTGSISTSAFGLSAVVLAQSASGQVYASRVTAHGGFHLSLPTGVRYRLAVAQPSGHGFHVVSNVRWTTSGQAHPWARLDPGDALRLGHLRPSSASGAVGSNQQGNCDDGCDDGDDDDANDDGDGMSCATVCRGGEGDDDDDSQGDEQGQLGGSQSGSCDGGQPSSSGMQGGGGGGNCQCDDMGSSQGVSCDDGQQGDDDGSDLTCAADGGSGPGTGGTGGSGGGTDAGPI